MGWGEPSVGRGADEVRVVEELGPVGRGSVLVVRMPHVSISPAGVAMMRADLASRIGHDEFGLIPVGSDDATAELLAPADLVELGWVYVGSPGVCPSCGSPDVVVQQGEELVRSCSSCGHRWSQYHPGRAA